MSKRSPEEIQALENPDNWVLDDAEKKPAAKNPRAVLSVAFARAEFARVNTAAEQVGEKVSEFVRKGALERVERLGGAGSFQFTGGGGSGVTLRSAGSNPTTRPSARLVREAEAELVTS